MPCEHNFGIIENIDPTKRYDNLAEFGSFTNALRSYKCVNIDDDAISGWWPQIENMKVYFHTFSRPEMGLARYGVTLIPPESLNLLHGITASATDPEFAWQVPPLLTTILKAKKKNKYVIHFGI